MNRTTKLLYLIFSVFLAIIQGSRPKIIQVVQIVRHGKRQIIKKHHSSASSESSQLTNSGFRQMVNLGGFNSKQYAKKLKLDVYNPKEVKVVSSERERCFYSARAYLYGFFWKDQGNPEHHSYLKKIKIGDTDQYQVDPYVEAELSQFQIKRLNPENNQMFRTHSHTACPNIKQHQSETGYLHDKKLKAYVQKIMAEFKKIKLDLSKLVDTKSNPISTVKYLYDYFHVKYFWDHKRIKHPISLRLFHMLKIAKTYIWYRRRFSRKEMNRVCITPLLKSISRDIIKGVNDFKRGAKDRKKLVLYSGQDNVMFSLLNELGLTSFKCFQEAVLKKRAITSQKRKCAGFPNFAERITFELHHIGLSFMVVVYHRKKRILSKTIEEFPKFMKSMQSFRFKEFCYGKDSSLMTEDNGQLDELEVKIYDKERQFKQAADKRKLENIKKDWPIYKRIGNKLTEVIGKRTVELGMFAIFCGFLFLSFKFIYGNYAAKRKLRWKTT